MAGAVGKFLDSLHRHNVDPEVIARVMAGYENVSDGSAKPRKAAFLIRAMNILDECLDDDLRYRVRDACACCTSGWREKAVQKVAAECAGRSLAERLVALRQVTHLGNPTLNADGSITAGIGPEGGCPCACSIFSGAGGRQPEEPVSTTYCLCCGGHFRHLYQIALDLPLRTRAVLSTSLASRGQKPCRFVFEPVRA